MPRKVFIIASGPPTDGDKAAALAAGATEIVVGIPPRLAALGITEVGYHEVTEPSPALPDEIPMWRIRAILAYDGIEGAIDAAVDALPDTADNRMVKARWKGSSPAPNFVRSSALVATMVEQLGPGLGLNWAAIDDIRARAWALTE